jgi:hypothetical protein
MNESRSLALRYPRIAMAAACTAVGDFIGKRLETDHAVAFRK